MFDSNLSRRFFYVISATKYLNNEVVVSFRAVLVIHEKDDDKARKILHLLEAIPSGM